MTKQNETMNKCWISKIRGCLYSRGCIKHYLFAAVYFFGRDFCWLPFNKCVSVCQGHYWKCQSTILKNLSCLNYTEVFHHGWPMLEFLGGVPTWFQPVMEDLRHFHVSKNMWNLVRLLECIWNTSAFVFGLMDLWFLPCVILYYQSYITQLVDWLYKMFILTIIHYKIPC